MESRQVIEDLVTEIAPNATVALFEQEGPSCRITLAGTTGVLAECQIPAALVDAADHDGWTRARVAAALKRCADDVVAPLPDGRG